MEEQSVVSIRLCLFVGLLITRHANSRLDTNHSLLDKRSERPPPINSPLSKLERRGVCSARHPISKSPPIAEAPTFFNLSRDIVRNINARPLHGDQFVANGVGEFAIDI
jgi:hypothetical protein